METRTYQVYKWEELSEKAKDKARQNHAVAIGYAWADEALKSLTALAEHFGGKLDDYSIDFFGGRPSFASFDMPDMSESDIRAKLKALGSYNRRTLKGNGDCKLTGVCHDEDAIDGFRKAFIRCKVHDLHLLMEAAFESWLKACQADCEYQYSDEAMQETSEANGYRYTEDGTLD